MKRIYSIAKDAGKNRKKSKKSDRSELERLSGSDIEPNHYGTGNCWDQGSDGNDANQYGTGIHFAMYSCDFDVNQSAAFAGEW